MVSGLSIFFLYLSAAICFLLPTVLIIFFKRKYKISFLSIIVGALIFFVFTQLLEKPMHIYLLMQNQQTAAILSNPVLYGLYGGLAAGIFEEVGRFVAYKFLLKGKDNWQDGIAYGIGHGGFEAIFLGGLAAVQYIVYSQMINAGTLEQALSGALPALTISQLKTSILSTPSYLFSFIGIERIMAVAIQIALSVMVLYGIRNKKNIYLLYAILLHAFVDFFAALSQKGIIGTVAVEIICVIFAAASIWYIIRTKDRFAAPAQIAAETGTGNDGTIDIQE